MKLNLKNKLNILLTISLVFVISSGLAAATPEFMGGEAEEVLSMEHVRIIPFTESGITEFNESPVLEEQVEEGELPPVAERLPDNPMVVEPEEEVGNYGGSMTLTQFSADNKGINGHVLVDTPLLKTRDFDNIETIPNYAKDWEYSDEGQTFTLYLREGVRWSDGEELTTDDVMFWYEDILQNEELTTVIPEDFRPGGELMEVEVLDDYKVEFSFAIPYYNFHENIDSTWYQGLEVFPPSHYLKEYHIDYNEEADELAEEEGFDDWVSYFENRNSWHFADPKPPERPTLAAWKPVEETASGRIYERNPYYFKVDPEGNQLPYIDEMRSVYVPDAESRLMNVLSGEIDYISSFLSFADYPTIVANEEDGNYDAWIGESLWANRVNFGIQQQPIEDDAGMSEILSDVRFRRALSLSIDREEIQELVFMGQGETRQLSYHPGTVDTFKDEWAEAYAEYDPERAKEYLDDMGIVDQNNDGWRQMPDGDDLLLQLLSNSSRSVWMSVAEMTESYWEDIGIQVNMDSVEEGIFFSRMWDNPTHHVFTDAMTGDLPPAHFYAPLESTYFEYGNWFLDYDAYREELMVEEIPEERADIAVEPPEEVKEWYVWNQMVDFVPPEEQDELLTKIGDKVAEELPAIGTVGMDGHVGVSSRGLRNIRKVGDNPSIGATRNAFLEQTYWEE